MEYFFHPKKLSQLATENVIAWKNNRKKILDNLKNGGIIKNIQDFIIDKSLNKGYIECQYELSPNTFNNIILGKDNLDELNSILCDYLKNEGFSYTSDYNKKYKRYYIKIMWENPFKKNENKIDISLINNILNDDVPLDISEGYTVVTNNRRKRRHK